MLQKEPNIILIILVITCIFFVAALFMIFYITIFIRRKKRHQEEKEKMRLVFDQDLIQTQIEVGEQTRKNLAADLHDNIGQVLSLTHVTLASINPDDKEKTRRKISDAQELITRSIRELRQLSKIIQGEQLIQQGLLKTIAQEITWLQRNGHYSVDFVHVLPDFRADTVDKDLFIYRLFQESLNNIIRHSRADKITIRLTYEPGFLQLVISDNGIGFTMEDPLANRDGLGLGNMQKRVNLLKGAMEVSSAENSGTSITFTIPYP